jgi:hypothetical protein
MKVGRARLRFSFGLLQMSLPARSETSADRQLLADAVAATKRARTAIKKFEAADAVGADKKVYNAARTVKKCLRKAARAAEAAQRVWLERIEQTS